MAAELFGIPFLGISEDEVGNYSKALAGVIAARGGLPKAETLIAKHGPWTNLLMVLATIYGPRAVMLWKLWEAARAEQKKRPLTLVPPRKEAETDSESEPDPAPDLETGKVVN